MEFDINLIDSAYIFANRYRLNYTILCLTKCQQCDQSIMVHSQNKAVYGRTVAVNVLLKYDRSN